MTAPFQKKGASEDVPLIQRCLAPTREQHPLSIFRRRFEEALFTEKIFKEAANFLPDRFI